LEHAGGGSSHPSGANVVFADAHVEKLGFSTDPRLLIRLATRAKGEHIDAGEVPSQ
jgi:prepilin-type processing-associated H-X9-DG protein